MSGQKMLAIHASDFVTYGCVSCGGVKGYSLISVRGAFVWLCELCEEKMIVVADEFKKNPFASWEAGKPDYLQIVEHPKSGK